MGGRDGGWGMGDEGEAAGGWGDLLGEEVGELLLGFGGGEGALGDDDEQEGGGVEKEEVGGLVVAAEVLPVVLV